MKNKTPLLQLSWKQANICSWSLIGGEGGLLAIGSISTLFCLWWEHPLANWNNTEKWSRENQSKGLACLTGDIHSVAITRAGAVIRSWENLLQWRRRPHQAVDIDQSQPWDSPRVGKRAWIPGCKLCFPSFPKCCWFLTEAWSLSSQLLRVRRSQDAFWIWCLLNSLTF